MLSQPDKSDFIMYMIKYVETHETQKHWIIMKNSKVNNRNRNTNGKLKTILLIWCLKRKMFSNGQLMKQKSKLFAYVVMQQWGVNYWVEYAPVGNWTSVRSLMEIVIIY